jgi:hypothetical protein
MNTMLGKCASRCLDAGMTPFLNDEMRVYSPLVYRGNKKRRLFNRKHEYKWIVSALTNSLLQLAKRRDFVLGIAVVTAEGIKLSAFTSQFELASQVDRSNASGVLCVLRNKGAG